jgi:hypothetical protein
MSQIMTKQLLTGRKFVWTLIAALTMAVGFSSVPGVGLGQAHAVSCHVFSSSKAGATDYYFYTPIYTVPSSSGCVDINIGAIGTSNHCANMKVEFFPSSGGSYFGSEKYLCSSTVDDHKVIASAVKNGTRYRIWAAYPTTAIGVTYGFKIID